MKQMINKPKFVLRIENEFGLNIEKILLEMYVKRNMSLEQITKILRIKNKITTKTLLRECGIYSHKLKSIENKIKEVENDT